MITVIHLRDSGFVGGPEKQILGQSRLLDRARFVPIILSFSASAKNALTEAALREGIEAECLPDGKIHARRALSRLRVLLRRSENPAVVSSGFRADFLARAACQAENMPWMAWFHGYTAATPRVRLYEAVDRRILRGARGVIALCGRTAASLRGFGMNNVIVVPNGIDAEAVRSEGDRKWARRELAMREGVPVIGTVSRLSKEKGIDILIRSAPDILRAFPSARFVIVGDGPLRSTLERKATDLGIVSNVTFTGHRTDAVALMKGFDIFTLPSLRENQPVALLEAMACGISAVATDVGGVGEMLSGTGVRPVPSASVRALTAALLRLLHDVGLRNAQASALLARAECFSFERHVKLIQDVYEDVTGE